LEETEDKINQPSLGRETRTLLKNAGLKAKKSLGQHFLVDKRVLGKIMVAGGVSEDDVVIEVGPGLGVLTQELACHARQVICIEIDANLASNLGARLSEFNNVTIINRDVLDTSPSDVLPPGQAHYKVIANLPYYITSPVLRHFLEANIPPDLMVVMVQKEVARSIAAKPGKMSLLSVGVQLYGRAEIIATVPARSFHPVPKEESAIVRVASYPKAVVPQQYRNSFFDIVRAGFGSPRKQLINTLSHGLGMDKASVLGIMLEAGIDPIRRAESLSIDDWHRLWCFFRAGKGEG
jgi:16S rRNA (adenine1518-N6/adenine1519-N6)-dimethyltransferase